MSLRGTGTGVVGKLLKDPLSVMFEGFRKKKKQAVEKEGLFNVLVGFFSPVFGDHSEPVSENKIHLYIITHVPKQR